MTQYLDLVGEKHQHYIAFLRDLESKTLFLKSFLLIYIAFQDISRMIKNEILKSLIWMLYCIELTILLLWQR